MSDALAPCGHLAALTYRTCETQTEICEMCDVRSMLRDALTMERELRAELAAAVELHERAGKTITEALGPHRNPRRPGWLYDGLAEDIKQLRRDRDELRRMVAPAQVLGGGRHG